MNTAGVWTSLIGALMVGALGCSDSSSSINDGTGGTTSTVDAGVGDATTSSAGGTTSTGAASTATGGTTSTGTATGGTGGAISATGTQGTSSNACSAATATGDPGAYDTDTLGDRTPSATSYEASAAYSSNASGVTKSGMAYTATTADTPAIKVAAGGTLVLTGSQANKASGDTASEDNSNFYGMNAGVLASSSSSTSNYASSTAASLSLSDATITTSAKGANGAFAFGEKATVTLDHVTIATSKDSSRGVDATYGGTVTISNSKITTQGAHCAALASDRYQGARAPAINASNVVGTTAGDGSPGIYSTGTFTVDHATLTATGSEAAAIEGLNSITLTDSELSGNAKWGVMIYQSMSGDSSQGTGKFSMTNGSLTNNDAGGPMFFVCDTSAVVTLENVTLTNKSDLLLAASTAAAAKSCGISNVNSSWGTLGGTVSFTATHQTLDGEIKVCDAKSSLALTLAGSTLNSKINTGNLSTGGIALTLDACSVWNLTGNSYVTSLAGAGTINKKGFTLTVSGATASTLLIND